VNHLAKVEGHARRLEKIAADMDAAGIGGHDVKGHAAVLRHMAGSMRADAAHGKMPYRYESSGAGVFASASDVATPRPTKGRPVVTVAELIAAKGPEVAPLVKRVRAQARRLGYDLPLDRHIDLFELDQAIAGRGDRIERLSLKSNLHSLHLVP
jgi:hypothetical protein